jgi:electron transport complex protein RnfG
MSMVVGVDPDLSVSGVVIVSSSETIGLGTKTEDPEWLSQFIGKKAPIGVNSGDNHIDAVTGATVSSTTVTNGVNAALEVAAQVKGEKAK